MEDLLLLSGNDIPFIEANLTIHQPTIKEIAYIGEEAFYSGCEFLNFSKDNLFEEDRIHLDKMSNFEILMSMMKNKSDTNIQLQRTYALMVLSLIFPLYSIQIIKEGFLFKKENEETHLIDKSNFDKFKSILNQMFALKKDENKNEYNPDGDMARKIAEKFKKRKAQLAEQKEVKIDIISRYVSILTVGERKDMNSFMNYTVYQLFDEFKRYELKTSFDFNLQARMAGADIKEEVEDWMRDIHS